MTEPHWKGRGIALAAQARKEREAKEAAKPRDIVSEAAALVGNALGTSVVQNQGLIGAIMISQALDRLGETITEAAAISRYKG